MKQQKKVKSKLGLKDEHTNINNTIIMSFLAECKRIQSLDLVKPNQDEKTSAFTRPNYITRGTDDINYSHLRLSDVDFYLPCTNSLIEKIKWNKSDGKLKTMLKLFPMKKNEVLLQKDYWRHDTEKKKDYFYCMYAKCTFKQAQRLYLRHNEQLYERKLGTQASYLYFDVDMGTDELNIKAEKALMLTIKFTHYILQKTSIKTGTLEEFYEKYVCVFSNHRVKHGVWSVSFHIKFSTIGFRDQKHEIFFKKYIKHSLFSPDYEIKDVVEQMRKTHVSETKQNNTDLLHIIDLAPIGKSAQSMRLPFQGKDSRAPRMKMIKRAAVDPDNYFWGNYGEPMTFIEIEDETFINSQLLSMPHVNLERVNKFTPKQKKLLVKEYCTNISTNYTQSILDEILTNPKDDHKINWSKNTNTLALLKHLPKITDFHYAFRIMIWLVNRDEKVGDNGGKAWRYLSDKLWGKVKGGNALERRAKYPIHKMKDERKDYFVEKCLAKMYPSYNKIENEKIGKIWFKELFSFDLSSFIRISVRSANYIFSYDVPQPDINSTINDHNDIINTKSIIPYEELKGKGAWTIDEFFPAGIDTHVIFCKCGGGKTVLAQELCNHFNYHDTIEKVKEEKRPFQYLWFAKHLFNKNRVISGHTVHK